MMSENLFLTLVHLVIVVHWSCIELVRITTVLVSIGVL